MSKPLNFVPMIATIIGGIIIILDGLDDVSFTLDFATFSMYMVCAVSGIAAYGIYKKISKK